MISEAKRKDLEKQGYRLVGNHSAIKVCLWTKKALRSEDVCYKCTFYGINTHRCVQMTPSLMHCDFRCQWCWRDICSASPSWSGPVDEPEDIVEGCIREHVRYLQGFGGNAKADSKLYEEANRPLHFAISLSGEPTMYPRLGELIRQVHKRNMTTFLVTNGSYPEPLRALINENEPTQLYITLPAPDKETFMRCCSPLIPDGWERIGATLALLEKFSCRKTIRMTLAKDLNMVQPESYAEMLKGISADFVELKAYMWVGYSRARLEISNMPLHSEIMEFGKKVSAASGYKIIDEKPESRVVLLMRQDKKDRIMKF